MLAKTENLIVCQDDFFSGYPGIMLNFAKGTQTVAERMNVTGKLNFNN